MWLLWEWETGIKTLIPSSSTITFCLSLFTLLKYNKMLGQLSLITELFFQFHMERIERSVFISWCKFASPLFCKTLEFNFSYWSVLMHVNSYFKDVYWYSYHLHICLSVVMLWVFCLWLNIYVHVHTHFFLTLLVEDLTPSSSECKSFGCKFFEERKLS